MKRPPKSEYQRTASIPIQCHGLYGSMGFIAFFVSAIRSGDNFKSTDYPDAMSHFRKLARFSARSTRASQKETDSMLAALPRCGGTPILFGHQMRTDHCMEALGWQYGPTYEGFRP